MVEPHLTDDPEYRTPLYKMQTIFHGLKVSLVNCDLLLVGGARGHRATQTLNEPEGLC